MIRPKPITSRGQARLTRGPMDDGRGGQRATLDDPRGRGVPRPYTAGGLGAPGGRRDRGRRKNTHPIETNHQ